MCRACVRDACVTVSVCVVVGVVWVWCLCLSVCVSGGSVSVCVGWCVVRCVPCACGVVSRVRGA